MKLAIFIIFTLAVHSYGAQTEVKLGSLLSATGKDAVQSAINLLLDLRRANTDAEKQADTRNRSEEAQGLKNIQALTQLVNLNKRTLDHATAYRKQVESDFTETKNYLNWIANRKKEIDRKRGELHRQRCYSNALFVKAIKENQDALQVIQLLYDDLRGYLSSAAQLNMAQVNNDITEKLKVYTHLFKEQAVKEFSQLATEENLNNQNKETIEAQRTRIQKLLDDLRKNLAEALKSLEVNEIKAAYDLARWVSDSENEKRFLNDEAGRKATYLDKLTMLLTGARNAESKSKGAWEEAVKTLNQAVEELRNKRYFYAREKARRVEENSLLDELIRLFKDKVGAMGERV